MAELYIQPAGNEHGSGETFNAWVHYRDTIEKGVQLSEFEPYLSEPRMRELKEIHGDGPVYLWGLRPGKTGENYWSKMTMGDKVLFFVNGKYDSLMEITLTIHNKDLALKLWDRDSEAKTWEYIYFVKGVQTLDLGREDIHKKLGYDPEKSPMGIRRVPKTRMPNNSVKKFVQWLVGTTPSGYSEDPFFENAEGLPEGAKKKVPVNVYERKPVNREKCLEHYGEYKCQVCNFDFEERYGELGKKYIEVHHTVPVSQMGAGYVVDPTTELVPVCSNCHSMIHRKKGDPLSIDELKKLLK